MCCDFVFLNANRRNQAIYPLNTGILGDTFDLQAKKWNLFWFVENVLDVYSKSDEKSNDRQLSDYYPPKVYEPFDLWGKKNR